jgi:O-antigen ligase
MLLLILLAWLASGQWQDKWHTLKQSSAAIATGLFIGMVVLGFAYGEGNYGSHYLTKYASLLILPVLLSLQLSPAEKWRAIDAFCAAMTITLLLSFLIWLQYLPTSLFNGTAVDNPIVFKLHITHGFFMVLAAFFLYTRAQQFSDQPAKRLVLLAITALMIVNVLLMVKGRTGQAAFAVLLVYLFHLRFPRYGLLVGALCAAALAGGAYSISPSFKERTDIAVTEIAQWETRRGDPSSSMGTRLDYYSTSLSIIKQHPIFGVGTNGFPQAYEKQIAGTVLKPSNNPHNQYLLTTAQYGLIGLAVLLGFYTACGLQASRQPQPFAKLAMGVLLAYLAGNLFNSFMLDFSERVFFAWSMGLLLSAGSPRPHAS